MDLLVCSPRIPIPEEKIIGSEFSAATGGKGANQAITASRMGAGVNMIGKVEEDLYSNSRLAGPGILAAIRLKHTERL